MLNLTHLLMWCTARDDMMEDMRRVSDDRARMDREAAERQGRERAQAHLASLSMGQHQQQGGQGGHSQQPGGPPSWPQPPQPNNYPPTYQASLRSLQLLANTAQLVWHQNLHAAVCIEGYSGMPQQDGIN